MENKILLERLADIPQIILNKHLKSERINGECITRNPKSRRKNVIGDINPEGSYFRLYKDGEWISKNKLSINTIEEAIEWIKKVNDNDLSCKNRQGDQICNIKY
ncbi:hypothetical protein GMD78_05045 [Ornithinibacillus sp. L9]|uniref:Uncharacterized protein n=1 Tax=Ornithinibacillus caprae TaxID=2678566 RepID=A0A6N8FKE7_9BACI|nr:hypothetical protein [Ornithinibacillus caprae]MUK87768.1 hypothetical protein [Ornithinibacillus caprae]